MLLRLAKVAVDKATFRFDKLFSYLAPQTVQVGQQVLVPFGRGSKLRQGIVLEVEEAKQEDTLKLKEIKSVLSEDILNDEMLRLVHFLKERTFCSYYDAVKLITPKGTRVKLNTFYTVTPEGQASLAENTMPPAQEQVLDALNQNGETELKKLQKAFSEPVLGILKQLEEKGLIEKREEAKKNYQDKKLLKVKLTENYKDTLSSLTKRQRELVELLEEKGTLTASEIYYHKQITNSVVQNTKDKGAVDFFEVSYNKNTIGAQTKTEKEISLTKEQQTVFHVLENSLNTQGHKKPFLLFGVTGSGKTVVYLKLIEKALQRGQSALLMVPEIGLTPQIINYFTSYFGNTVAVIHSELSVGERLSEYNKIKSGQAKIVIGTRSAVFAPCENLGVIIVDEEQESSYFSEQSPRFSAKEVALFRAKEQNCTLLFASATPSVESFYRAQQGIYSLLTLKKRFNKQNLPKTAVVDMKQELLNGNTKLLSHKLKKDIEENIKQGKQSILLINRRGYESVAICADCLSVIKCPHCNVALTYHKANNKLMCHHCNFIANDDIACNECASKSFRFVGYGTQKIEEEISKIENSKVLRMDMDTTTSKGSHDKYLQAFADKSYNVLVGTQMIAKGLDFENVTLAGVLNVEGLLYNSGYKGHEKLFSLIAQVIGRSGRGGFHGRAVIQTIEPDHPVIQLAAKQDYISFYKDEIATRKALLYPPFCDICLIGFRGKDDLFTLKQAKKFVDQLKKVYNSSNESLPMKVLGPTPYRIGKLNDQFRYKVMIKCKNNEEFRHFLRSTLNEYLKEEKDNKTTVVVDFHNQNEV